MKNQCDANRVQFKPKDKGLITALTVALLGGYLGTTSQVQAEGFIEDSRLDGGLYYMQRDRSRKDITTNKYEDNLKHSTFNASLDFSSGYLADMVGLDLGVYGALELSNSGPAHPNEIGFSNSKSPWEEKWEGDRSGLSFYKAALKFKSGPFWARGGYIQPAGQTLLAPNWSLLPGTYRGAEAGMVFDFENVGELSMSYMWADEYKAPWYRNTYEFRKMDKKTKVDYLHSIGAKYDFKNDLVLELAFGQAKNYMEQYFGKVSYQYPVVGNNLAMSYQFYGADDRDDNPNSTNNVYDGLAWLQAMTFAYQTGPLKWRLEGTLVKAEGSMGYFLQQMTTSHNSASNGRLDIWWNGRSDFNANGEKAAYAGVMYDLSGWDLKGWEVGTSYAYGWDAKPGNGPGAISGSKIEESAWNADIVYTITEGKAKDSKFWLHYTKYDNHSDIPSWGGGYNNIFQDEHDVKFIVTVPFSVF